VQVIESVLPSQAIKTRGQSSKDGLFVRASAVTAAFVVFVPVLALGAFQFLLWLLGLWVEMSETAPLLLAQ
jgi:hypothetical protein